MELRPTTRRGGARKGAGRPKGSGHYGEETVAVRLPKRFREAVLEAVRRELAKEAASKKTNEEEMCEPAYGMQPG